VENQLPEGTEFRAKIIFSVGNLHCLSERYNFLPPQRFWFTTPHDISVRVRGLLYPSNLSPNCKL